MLSGACSMCTARYTLLISDLMLHFINKLYAAIYRTRSPWAEIGLSIDASHVSA